MFTCSLMKPLEKEDEEDPTKATIIFRQKRNFDFCHSTNCIPTGMAIFGAVLVGILVKAAFLYLELSRPKSQPLLQPGLELSRPIPQPYLQPGMERTDNPQPGIAPPDVPQPGQPGGGDPPSANAKAAALAPPGTVPVAVFPPFSTPQAFAALCVIFSELTASEQRYNSNEYGRKKRDLLKYNRLQKRDYRQVTI